jgi:hypothetical protein
MVSSTIQHTSSSPISNYIHSLESLFELSAELINAFGGLILLSATLISILHTFQYFINDNIFSNSLVQKIMKCKEDNPAPKFWIGKGNCTIDNIRLRLGSGITFALELLVAADVIDTLTKPVHLYQMETLQKIAVVVAIRTALSYFLNKEIEELEHKVSKEKQH